MKKIIGLDIGGTKIHGALFDGNKMLKELTIATPKSLIEFERSVFKLVDFLSVGEKVEAIGIGMAGSVDSQKGLVRRSPNIKFIKNLNLIKIFNSRGFTKVKLDNDANCFTRAELMEGQGKKFKNFIALTFGTGIGGGIVINGQIYRGENNLGGELGHIISGGVFLEKQYQIARDKKDFLLNGKQLGQALVSFINIFAPQAIIIGGSYGIFESSKYLPIAKNEIKKYLLNDKVNTKILISKLKNAGTLGAALLIK